MKFQEKKKDDEIPVIRKPTINKIFESKLLKYIAIKIAIIGLQYRSRLAI